MGFRIVGACGDAAAVLHHFDTSRIDGKEVIRMSGRMGRSAAYFDRACGRIRVRWSRACLLSQNLQCVVRSVVDSFRHGPSAAITEARVRRAYKVGYVHELLARRGGR